MKLDTIVTSVLVACAIITTGVVVRREFLPSQGATPAESKPALVARWQEYLSKGIQMGSPQGKVQIIEFADFECPYCGAFHQSLKAAEERHPKQITVTYVHYPIPGHRFALPAARVAECAGAQGRFEAMHDQLFDGQDQFGLKPWGDYARAAEVPDLPAFDTCIHSTDPIPRVVEGLQLGKKLDIQATPTVIMNGWRLGHPPSEEDLDRMTERVLAGKSPVS
jgi:protein-disulfide isomerase